MCYFFSFIDQHFKSFTVDTKGRCNYGVDLWYNQKSSHPKFFIHFFIDNSNANISLYALNCPKMNFGYYLTFEIIFKL